MNDPFASLKGYVPLAYSGDVLVVGCLDGIYVCDPRLSRVDFVCRLPGLPRFWRVFARFRLIQRLLRLDAGPAIPLQEAGCILVFFLKRAFRVDIVRRTVHLESLPELHRNPLSLAVLRSGPHQGVTLFGEYRHNPKYESVKIYRRDSSGSWDVAYAFPDGEINHVHGIFEDQARSCLYILTGDFGRGACVWVSDLALSDVRPLLRQGQLSRACWVALLGSELIFATDTQEELNYLCSVDLTQPERVIRRFPIAGSSICFARALSHVIAFSTAVEPASSEKMTLGALFSTRPAAGTLGAKSCLYVGTVGEGFRIVFAAEKDWLPFGLFQFGNIKFPTGAAPDQQVLHFYCVALKGHDGVLYALNLPSDPR